MIKFGNKSLESFIQFKLNKTNNNFTVKELKSIKTLDLNPIDIDSSYNKVNLEDLKYFPNLKYLTISNMHVDIASFAFILRLEHLVSLTFINSTFQDLSILSNFKLEHIGFINSNLEDLGIINRVKSLKELTLINYKDIDLSYFINLNLISLELSNSTVKNENGIGELSNLSKLIVCNTNIMNLNFLNKLKKLKELYITKTQYIANKIIINNLVKNKVSVYIDNNILINKGEL